MDDAGVVVEAIVSTAWVGARRGEHRYTHPGWACSPGVGRLRSIAPDLVRAALLYGAMRSVSVSV